MTVKILALIQAIPWLAERNRQALEARFEQPDSALPEFGPEAP
jgi:hypothetical protein